MNFAHYYSLIEIEEEWYEFKLIFISKLKLMEFNSSNLYILL